MGSTGCAWGQSGSRTRSEGDLWRAMICPLPLGTQNHRLCPDLILGKEAMQGPCGPGGQQGGLGRCPQPEDPQQMFMLCRTGQPMALTLHWVTGPAMHLGQKGEPAAGDGTEGASSLGWGTWGTWTQCPPGCVPWQGTNHQLRLLELQ